VFHENVPLDCLYEKTLLLTDGAFLQVNAWDENFEHMVMISKKGSPAYKKKAMKTPVATPSESNHNRSKNYILEAKPDILPLIDMGIFTKEGKVVASMYDKYKQINRYIEIIDDCIGSSDNKELNIIDFGCGKSYLTFIVYYYLTYIKGIKANIIGLDLKKDVIEKCNEAAKRYNYENLRFELRDINGYKAPFDVDIVMTLHACDTATDMALGYAIRKRAKNIICVPCCHKELLDRYTNPAIDNLVTEGILKARFNSILTDSLRILKLRASGYEVSAIEYCSPLDTPKNLLIRARRVGNPDPRAEEEKRRREKKGITEYKSIVKEIDK
jgi:SAM-dependent methyltransferase